MNINFKQSILGSAIAFLIATSCCWLPPLVIGAGGGATFLSISNGIEEMSGIFMIVGIGLLGFGIFQWNKKSNMNKVAILESTLTCPNCDHQKKEIMPTDACQFFYECDNCKTVLKPKKGDCCVYCSYGTVPCPPIQLDEKCC